MAKKITAQVTGGSEQVLENSSKVKDALRALGLSGNYSATVNGEPAGLEDDLEDYSFVTFTEAVKGGL